MCPGPGQQHLTDVPVSKQMILIAGSFRVSLFIDMRCLWNLRKLSGYFMIIRRPINLFVYQWHFTMSTSTMPFFITSNDHQFGCPILCMGTYSQWCFVHRHHNNTWYTKPIDCREPRNVKFTRLYDIFHRTRGTMSHLEPALIRTIFSMLFYSPHRPRI